MCFWYFSNLLCAKELCYLQSIKETQRGEISSLTALVSTKPVFPLLIKFGLWQFHAHLQYILFTLSSCSLFSLTCYRSSLKVAHTRGFSFPDPLSSTRTVCLATNLAIPIGAWWAHSGTQREWWAVTQNPPVSENSLGKGKAFSLPQLPFLFVQEWL